MAYLLLPYWRPWTGHTILGIHTFALPVGLLLLGIFHRWLEVAVIDLLPGGWRDRLWPMAGKFRWGPARRTLLIGAAVWIGAVTHVFIDAMTHYRGQIVLVWPAAFRALHPWTGLPVYSSLQFGLGLIGTAMLGVSAMNWYRRQVPHASTGPRRLGVSWWMVTAAVGFIATAYALGRARGVGFDWWHRFAMHGAAGGLVLTALAVVGLSVVHALRRQPPPPGPAAFSGPGPA